MYVYILSPKTFCPPHIGAVARQTSYLTLKTFPVSQAQGRCATLMENCMSGSLQHPYYSALLKRNLLSCPSSNYILHWTCSWT